MPYGRVDKDSVFAMAKNARVEVNTFYDVLWALADNDWRVVKANDANNPDA